MSKTKSLITLILEKNITKEETHKKIVELIPVIVAQKIENYKAKGKIAKNKSEERNKIRSDSQKLLKIAEFKAKFKLDASHPLVKDIIENLDLELDNKGYPRPGKQNVSGQGAEASSEQPLGEAQNKSSSEVLQNKVSTPLNQELLDQKKEEPFLDFSNLEDTYSDLKRELDTHKLQTFNSIAAIQKELSRVTKQIEKISTIEREQESISQEMKNLVIQVSKIEDHIKNTRAPQKTASQDPSYLWPKKCIKSGCPL